MKKIIASLLMLIVCCSINAQDAYRMKHYKGFLDVGLSGLFIDGSNQATISLQTSHGYQFNPYVFLGAGIGLGVNCGSDIETTTVVPIFAQTRFNFNADRISPYLDIKGGYNVGDSDGGVFSPTIGVSMPVSRNCAIDFGLSYILNTHKYEYGYSSYYGYYYDTERICSHSIALGFGFEF